MKFLKFLIWKIGQFPKIAITVQLKKFKNFQNFKTWNIMIFF